ncbi:hypothetical protein ASZ90_006520 [hydrocarbon metagenome]|uniref:Uncharacterized protein n=1 Tax=hydrocarbon metagenome TaxID=938273 RepID=A0A0W8FSD8_9ZZZZ
MLKLCLQPEILRSEFRKTTLNELCKMSIILMAFCQLISAMPMSLKIKELMFV